MKDRYFHIVDNFQLAQQDERSDILFLCLLIMMSSDSTPCPVCQSDKIYEITYSKVFSFFLKLYFATDKSSKFTYSKSLG